MLTIGIILLIIGVITVVLAAVTSDKDDILGRPISPLIPALGWIALAIGVALIILALLLPALSTAPTYAAK